MKQIWSDNFSDNYIIYKGKRNSTNLKYNTLNIKMFTNKKIIIAAIIAAQSVLASDLLWFEDESDEPKSYDPSLEDNDYEMAEAEDEDDRRMLMNKNKNPEERGYFSSRNKNYQNLTR